MGIQTSGSLPVVDADDAVFTHRGVTWGIKFRQFAGDWRCVQMMTKSSSGLWSWSDSIIDDFDYGLRQSGMTLGEWFEKVFIVRLNELLNKMFPSGTDSVPVPEADKFIQLFDKVKLLKVTQKADGSVVASVV